MMLLDLTEREARVVEEALRAHAATLEKRRADHMGRLTWREDPAARSYLQWDAHECAGSRGAAEDVLRRLAAGGA